MLVALNAVTMALWSGLMEYNQEMIDHLMQREEAFWTDHVLPSVPPDPQNAADIRLRWPSHVPGAFVETNEETAPTYVELVRTKQQHKAIGARVEELSTILKVAMGDAEALTSDGRVLATGRGQVSSRIGTKRLAKERPDIAAAYRTRTVVAGVPAATGRADQR
jgi:predicted phage-related endonuclease